ncbi:uncharacterized protein [Chelonus insularis]|uniref:uncharacterized protein n=1 Tax=Chelonus insularis TaxID=460826 RepID=UPI00158B29AF|nr:uncharacterized protein LOC118068332 [Chelonus insularis]
MRSSIKARMHMRSISSILWSAIITLLSQIGLFARYNKPSIFPVQSMIEVGIQSPSFDADIIKEYLSLMSLIPFGTDVNTKIKKHLRINDYKEKGYVSSKYNITHSLINEPIFGIFMFDLFEKFERFFFAFTECWLTTSKFHDLKYGFESLMKHSPSIIKRIVSSRLRKPIPKHPMTKGISYSELEAFVCKLLTYAKRDFNGCLKEIKSLEKCIKTSLNRFPQSHNQYFALAHLNRLKRSINDLRTTCNMKEVNNKFSINCEKTSNENLSPSKKTVSFSNHHFMQLLASENITNYLKRIASRNKLVSNVLEEINTLSEIYRQSIITKNKLSEMSKENNHANESYIRISKALNKFEESIIEIISNVMNQLHRMTIQVQKSLVDAASNALEIDLSENLRTSNYFYLTMQRILSAHKKPKFSIKSKLIGDTQSNALIRKKDIQKPIKHLIVSMKRSSQIEATTKSSAIVTLANTFLLATVFYECISTLAVVMYGGNKNGNNISPETPNHDYDSYSEFVETNHDENYDFYGETSEPYPNYGKKIPRVSNNNPQNKYSNHETKIKNNFIVT